MLNRHCPNLLDIKHLKDNPPPQIITSNPQFLSPNLFYRGNNLVLVSLDFCHQNYYTAVKYMITLATNYLEPYLNIVYAIDSILSWVEIYEEYLKSCEFIGQKEDNPITIKIV